jgi:predicted phage terminase large subunit-like protein
VNAEARDLILKAKLLHDFLFFTRWFFKAQTGRRFHVARHHLAIAEALIKVAAGETKRLIINVPPRYGKTELAVKMFIAWCLANNPAAKFIHLSYSDDLALDNSSAIRELVKHEEFHRLFNISLKADSDSKKKWYTDRSGGVYATAAGGAITGFGAGLLSREREGTGSPADGFGGAVIIDDPLKPDDAFSETMRARVNRRFNNTIMSRLNSPETPIILIMQRLHEDDMAGFLLNGGSDEEWEHLSLCVINEDGEALWPEKHEIEKLRSMERADPYTFAGQYMQSPAPLEGGLFKPEKIAVVDALPPGIQFARGWDLAATAPEAGKKPDWTVGALVGRDALGRFCIADIVRFQGNPLNVEQGLLNTAALDGYEVPISGPQDPGQAGKSQAFGFIQKLAGYNVEFTPETGSKATRAAGLAAQIEAGNVYMLRAGWNKALTDEMRMFPNGTYDDQIDALSRAFHRIIAGKVWSFASA